MTGLPVLDAALNFGLYFFCPIGVSWQSSQDCHDAIGRLCLFFPFTWQISENIKLQTRQPFTEAVCWNAFDIMPLFLSSGLFLLISAPVTNQKTNVVNNRWPQSNCACWKSTPDEEVFIYLLKLCILPDLHQLIHVLYVSHLWWLSILYSVLTIWHHSWYMYNIHKAKHMITWCSIGLN